MFEELENFYFFDEELNTAATNSPVYKIISPNMIQNKKPMQ